MKIYLLTLNGVFDTGLAALQDTFSIANDLRLNCSSCRSRNLHKARRHQR